MKNVVTVFNETGICEVDLQKVIEQWNANCFISQYHEKYTLVGSAGSLKVQISKIQAHDLIGRLDLLMQQSTVFRNAKTWLK